MQWQRTITTSALNYLAQIFCSNSLLFPTVHQRSRQQDFWNRLLERFRDSQSYGYLVKLASKPFYPDGRELNLDAAQAEFKYSIDRLNQRSRQTLADKINQSERKGLLGLKRR